MVWHLTLQKRRYSEPYSPGECRRSPKSSWDHYRSLDLPTFERFLLFWNFQSYRSVTTLVEGIQSWWTKVHCLGVGLNQVCPSLNFYYYYCYHDPIVDFGFLPYIHLVSFSTSVLEFVTVPRDGVTTQSRRTVICRRVVDFLWCLRVPVVECESRGPLSDRTTRDTGRVCKTYSQSRRVKLSLRVRPN